MSSLLPPHCSLARPRPPPASTGWLPAAPSHPRAPPASLSAAPSAPHCATAHPHSPHRAAIRSAPDSPVSPSARRAASASAAVGVHSPRPSAAARRAVAASAADGADVAGRLGAEEREAVGSADVAIITNGPGEVAAWVAPVAAALARLFGDDPRRLRVSVLLAPCPHASGNELAVLQAMPHVHRCTGPGDFLHMLLFARPAAAAAPHRRGGERGAGGASEGRAGDQRQQGEGDGDGDSEWEGEAEWGWRRRGVVVFLGGEQVNAVLLAWRLGYRCLVYAEDAARWPWLVDMSALRSPLLLPAIPPSLLAAGRARVVGDLFLAAVGQGGDGRRGEEGRGSGGEGEGEEGEVVVGLLPGSKDVKLMIGVPFFLAVAHALKLSLGARVRFILPLAPTVPPASLARFASARLNPLIARHAWLPGRLHLHGAQGAGGDGGRAAPGGGEGHGWEYVGRLVSGEEGREGGEGEGDEGEEWQGGEKRVMGGEGVEVEVWRAFPSYTLLSQCSLALTTVGTNTAELAALGVPMVVVLPTQSLELFQGASGGVLGLLPSLLPAAPAAALTRFLNAALLRSLPFLSWPNRWAGRQVVPEVVGEVRPGEVAAVAAELLGQAAALEGMRRELRQVTWEYGGGRHGAGGGGEGEEGGDAADAIAHEVLKLLRL
ncbi:hypothetical protein CLOP_g9340 [Closterium sp. NIES-67]|nr:hypothetical protein CLOP_g9340 [Closterium sp. NIES-67]